MVANIGRRAKIHTAVDGIGTALTLEFLRGPDILLGPHRAKNSLEASRVPGAVVHESQKRAHNTGTSSVRFSCPMRQDALRGRKNTI